MTTAEVNRSFWMQQAGPSILDGPPRRRDGLTALFITLVWAWICVPKVIQTLLSPKFKYVLAVNDNAQYSALASTMDRFLYLGVLSVSVIILLVRAPRRGTSGFGSLLLLTLPWAYIVSRDLYLQLPLSREGIAYPVVVLALWSLRPELKRLSTLGYLVSLTAGLSVVIAIMAPDQGILRTVTGEVIATDKQVLSNGLLVGIFTQPNNLGQFLAVGLPTILLIRRLWHRIPLLAITSFAIVWSASRGAMIAVVVGLVSYLVMVTSGRLGRRILGPVVVLVLFALVSVLPFVTTNPASFSNRGLIWTVSLNAWGGSVWTGYGVNWYQVVGSTSARISGSVFHGHNQVVQLLATGGLLFAFAVLPVLLAAVVRSAAFNTSGHIFGICWLAVLAGASVFEKSLAFVDNRNFLVVSMIPLALLVFGPGRNRS
jgi:O-Antigen ligase